MIERSLPELALYVRSHSKCHEIKGIIGITMLNRGYDKLGFEAVQISFTWYRLLKWMSLKPIYFGGDFLPSWHVLSAEPANYQWNLKGQISRIFTLHVVKTCP
ncbi:hypothetical protein ACVLD2_000698 [Paenibacillus sp. PvR052]|nr:hypothetical protein [Paenibacillus sp. PvP091]MBP1169225.1 hypothetical protein [Paenibacillus sp. PvR098]MBP2440253.1 hypothetical protein [Paenibacillus sp. PvP052]